MSAERICPNCHRSFFSDEEACPHDGGKLVFVATEHDERLGRLIDGKFTIDALIAEGGMGSVYRATQRSMNRHVAVKILHRAYSKDAVVVRRFLREAKTASRLNHPNVITLFDYGQSESGDLYLMMELLSGESLGQLLEREGALEAERAVGILAQVLDGLHHAHQAGMIHRDLKPDNIFVRPGTGRSGEFAKVLDFGVAKIQSVEGAEALTRTGMICGTPAYMSPEQAMGTDLDARSDIYAAGIVLYECLSGLRPFDSDSPVSILLSHVNDPPPPLVGRTPVPSTVERILLQTLAKRPEDRPASCLELKERLFEALEAHSRNPEFSQPPKVDTQRGVVPPSETQLTRVEASLEPRPLNDLTTRSLPDLAPESAGRERTAAMVAVVVALLALIAAGGVSWALGWWGGSPPGPPAASDGVQLADAPPIPNENAPAEEARRVQPADDDEDEGEPEGRTVPTEEPAASEPQPAMAPTPAARGARPAASPGRRPRADLAGPPEPTPAMATDATVRVSVRPRDAKIRVNGNLIGAGTITLPRPLEGRSLTLTISRTGYKTLVHRVSDSSPATMSLELDRRKKKKKVGGSGFIIE